MVLTCILPLSLFADTVTMSRPQFAASPPIWMAMLAGLAIPFAASLAIARYMFHRGFGRKHPPVTRDIIPRCAIHWFARPRHHLRPPGSNADRRDRQPDHESAHRSDKNHLPDTSPSGQFAMRRRPHPKRGGPCRSRPPSVVVGRAASSAAFSTVYAFLLLAFYLPLCLLPAALILRGVACEFRHRTGPHMRVPWDIYFAGGSLVAALCRAPPWVLWRVAGRSGPVGASPGDGVLGLNEF
jgi:hypothetical protein